MRGGARAGAAPGAWRPLFLIGLILLAARSSSAAPLPDMSGVSAYSNAFGAAWSPGGRSAAPSYLETAARIVQGAGSIEAGGPAKLMYRQGEALVAGGLPRSLGSMLALRSEDGIAVLVSGRGFRPDPSAQGSIDKGQRLGGLDRGAEGQYGYDLRVLDLLRGRWINPLLVASLAPDLGQPKIQALVLRGSKVTAELTAPVKGRISLPQGTYAVFVGAVDAATPGALSSGIFRYKVQLDGAVAVDKMLDAALASDAEGLSFAGLPAPSSANLDDRGRLGLGKLDLPRGQHLAELFVYDFAGNLAQGAWRLSVE